MLALHINRQRVTDHSPKEALRQHIARLSPIQQREFIDAALQLIAVRGLYEEGELTKYAPFQQPSACH